MNNDSLKLLVFSDLHITGDGETYLSRKRVEKITTFFSGILPGDSPWARTGKYKSALESLKRLQSLLDEFSNSVDHILFTGDIIDSGVPRQLRGFARLIEGYSDSISFVSGNHDLLPFDSVLRKVLPNESTVAKQIYEIDESADNFESGKIMFLKYIAPGFLLVGINTNRRNNLHFRGKLSPSLLSDIKSILESPEYEDKVKIFAMHHNPVFDDRSHYDYLPGRDEFISMLSDYADRTGRSDVVVIFGHTHRRYFTSSIAGEITFICVPMFAQDRKDDYLLLHIDKDGRVCDVSEYDS